MRTPTGKVNRDELSRGTNTESGGVGDEMLIDHAVPFSPTLGNVENDYPQGINETGE